MPRWPRPRRRAGTRRATAPGAGCSRHAAEDQRRGDEPGAPTTTPPSPPSRNEKIWRRFDARDVHRHRQQRGQDRADRVAGEQQPGQPAGRARRRRRRKTTVRRQRGRRRTRARGAGRTRGRRGRTGMRTAIAAPSAAPDAVPSTYGSASGLRSRPWNVAPATARPAPDEHRGQDPRQPQVPDDRLGRGRPVAAEVEAERAPEDDPERVAGPIRTEPSATPATSEHASTTQARPTAISRGRPRTRAARPTGREVGERRRVATQTRYGAVDAAGGGRTRSGYIASARLRRPVGRRGPGRVISVSLTAGRRRS